MHITFLILLIISVSSAKPFPSPPALSLANFTIKQPPSPQTFPNFVTINTSSPTVPVSNICLHNTTLPPNASLFNSPTSNLNISLSIPQSPSSHLIYLLHLSLLAPCLHHIYLGLRSWNNQSKRRRLRKTVHSKQKSNGQKVHSSRSQSTLSRTDLSLRPDMEMAGDGWGVDGGDIVYCYRRIYRGRWLERCGGNSGLTKLQQGRGL